MSVSDDMQLLREYATGNSEEAFATLVSRHINLVYSAALRRVGNPHQAEEITQSVFVLLAKKARQLSPATILAGWLYQTAWQTAANHRRTEARRQLREQEAHMQSTDNESDPDLWQHVGPILDEAMADLSETDRNAIVLRFFENKPMKAVGAALGTSDDAAKMRVSRAVDKLRDYFLKRGLPLSGQGLAAAIAENSVQAAPSGLAAAVTAGVGQSVAAAGSTFTMAKGAVQLMTWTKIYMTIGAVALVLAAVEWKRAAAAAQTLEQLRGQLRDQAQLNQTQQGEIAKLDGENSQLRKEIQLAARDTAKARNHNSMAAAAAAAAARPKNNLASMLKDPAMMEFMRDTAAKQVRKQYGPLAKQLNLPPDVSDKFYQILTDRSLNNMTQSTDLMASGDLSGLKKITASAQQQADASLQALLGDADFAQYQTYQAGIGDRAMLEQMKGDFADEPLSDAQQQQLLDTMQATRKTVMGAAYGGPGPSVADPVDAMEQNLTQQQTINQQVLQQAAAFLSPSQLETLGNSQTNMVNMMKTGYVMAQKMFGQQSGAPK